MDAGTGLTILGSAIGSAKLLEKILGPTADYLGRGIENWTQKRIQNVGRIFSKACFKLNNKIDDEGSIPPKVLKAILDDGSFCEDELSAEYFGGVLAASRSNLSRDDRGVYILSCIKKLSSYQIRTHYIFYYTLKILFNGDVDTVTNSIGRSKYLTFIPMESYLNSMAVNQKELKMIDVLITHSLFGLKKEDLIETFYFGDQATLKTKYNNAKASGILFAPSALGVELFMWAHGAANMPIMSFFESENKFSAEIEIEPVEDAEKAH